MVVAGIFGVICHTLYRRKAWVGPLSLVLSDGEKRVILPFRRVRRKPSCISRAFPNGGAVRLSGLVLEDVPPGIDLPQIAVFNGEDLREPVHLSVGERSRGDVEVILAKPVSCARCYIGPMIVRWPAT
jgi:hypothetical protein